MIKILQESPAPLPNFQHDANEDMSSKNTDEMIKDKAKLAGSIEAVPDSPAPVPFSHAGEGSNEAVIKEKVKKDLVQLPSDSPMPFTSQNVQDIDAKEKAAASQLSILRDGPTASNFNSTTVNDLAREEVGMIHENSRHVELSAAGAELSGAQNSAPGSTNSRQMQFSVSETETVEAPQSRLHDSSVNTDIEDQRPTDHVTSLNASVSVIPQAFLVDETDHEHKVLAVAEEILPWWQRKVTYIFCLVVLLVVIGVAAGTSHLIKRNAAHQLDNVMLFMTNETTASPSTSSAPTSSQIPSAQPSACVDRSSLEPQKLDFAYFNMTYPKCAIDGGYTVVVDIFVVDGIANMYVVFYKLTRYGVWEKDQVSAERLTSRDDADFGPDSESWKSYDIDVHWDDTYNLKMSGNTVLVGAPFMNNGTGTVFVYEYDERIKEWIGFDDAMVPDDGSKQGRRFGDSLDIDGDLAVVFAPGDNDVFVFRQARTGWDQMTTFGVPTNTSHVALSGNTIVATVDNTLYLYEYSEAANSVESKQQLVLSDNPDPIYWDGVGNLGLSENHLAVTLFNSSFTYEYGCYDYYLRSLSPGIVTVYEILLFYRPNATEDYMFLQQFNSLDFDQGFAPYLALDEDFLVVGGAGNKTNTFTFSNGYWEESLILDTSDECGSQGYDDAVYISKRNAIVSTSDSVYVYNIDDCAPMPSSMPSEAPTAQPTVTCYWVDFFVEYYHANEPEWLLEQLNETDIDEAPIDEESTMAPTLRPTFGATSNGGYDPYHVTYSSEKKCLQKGFYKFTMFKDPLFYSLTSYEDIIVEGGDSRYKESTVFQIPFQ